MPSMQMMMAASGEPNPITLAASYTVSDPGPGTGHTAAWRLESDGDISQFTSDTPLTDVGDWINPKTGMSNYEVKGTLISGSYNGPSAGGEPLDVWLSLGATQTYAVEDTSCVLAVDIRRVSGIILGSTVVNLNA